MSQRGWTTGLALVIGCLIGSVDPAGAQTTYTWNGSVNGNWSNAGNWTGGVPVNSPTLTDVAFAGTANLLTTVDLLPAGGPFDIRTLTFSAGSGTFNITPTNTNVTNLRIGTGGIANNSTNNQTISNPLTIGASHTWTAATGNLFVDGPVTATGQTLTFDGASEIRVTDNITGGAFVKNGAGTTTLAGNNTPTSVTVNAGTLVVNRVGTGSPIGTGLVTLGGGTLSFRVFGNPVAVTGFNHDVITTVNEFGGAAPYGTTRAVDGADGNGAFVYFQQGVNAANPTFGAPASGRFTANAINYQFGDYTGNNVLSFASNTPGSPATTLTLDTPGAFRSLSLMNVTGSGSSVYSFTLNFGDGSSTTVAANPSPDWFNGTTAPTIFQVNGRLNRNNGTFDAVGSGNPRIYATNYTLTAIDRVKTLNSVTFATTTTGTYTFNVFGLSGTAGSDDQVYTNSVAVTADSTLDQQNVANVTLGPITIGANTLTTTGIAGTTLTLGAATLSGNPTFSPQTGTLTLGALTGGATARTITKTGAGTLTLPAAAASLATGSIYNANAGTTNLSAPGALGTATTVNTASGGTINVGANQTFAALAGTGGTVALGTNTLTINGGTAVTFGGSLAGGNLIVTGAGTSQRFTGSTAGTAVTIQNGGRVSAFAPASLGSGGVTMTGTSTLSLGVGAAPASITGFGNDGTGYNLQGVGGVPLVFNNVLTITPATNGVAATVWNQTAVPVAPFNATFRYTQGAGAGGADGMTFALQNQSATALGIGGGGLGYGGITPSVAFALNIFAGNTAGYNVTANGVQPTPPYLATAPVDLTAAGAGNEVTVALSYDGVNLTGTLTQGANVFTLPSIPVNISGLIGPTAFVGFTGGTGGLNAEQAISNFTFNTLPTATYNTAVTVSPAAAATIAVDATAASPVVTMGTLTVGAGVGITVQAETTVPANQAYGLTFGATTLAGATNVTVNNNGTGLGTLTLGATSGAGGITKLGSARLTLIGAGTYTGNTTVTAGSMALTGTGSFATSPVIDVQTNGTLITSGVTGGANFDGTRFALASGQTIMGNGTVSGPLGVRSGSTVSPGASPGRLNVTGDVVFAAGSTFRAELNGATVATQYDQLTVAGNVTLGDATLNATLGFSPTPTNTLFIIDNTGANAITGTFIGLANNSTTTIGLFFAQISYFGNFGTGGTTGGNDVVLFNFQPVPEPTTVFGIAAAGSGFGWLIRRRRLAKA